MNKEKIIEEYKKLLDRDIDDYVIGIRNLRVQERMRQIEKKLKEAN